MKTSKHTNQQVKTSIDDGVVILTKEQAKAMLPRKDMIHTFVNPGVNVLIGADWEKSKLESEIDACVCELAGSSATSMGHGLCIHRGNGLLFVETNRSEEKE